MQCAWIQSKLQIDRSSSPHAANKQVTNQNQLKSVRLRPRFALSDVWFSTCNGNANVISYWSYYCHGMKNAICLDGLGNTMDFLYTVWPTHIANTECTGSRYRVTSGGYCHTEHNTKHPTLDTLSMNKKK
jgi:hypothetical protein